MNHNTRKSRFLTILWLVAIALALLVSVQYMRADDGLTLTLACWDRPEPGAAGNMYINVSYSGAPSAWGGSGLSWSHPGLPEGNLVAGDYPRAIVASVDGVYAHNIIQLWTDDPYHYADIEFSIDTEAPECAELDAAKYGADGGWITITINDPICDGDCTWDCTYDGVTWYENVAVTPIQDEGNGAFTRLVIGHEDDGRQCVVH